MKKILLCLLMVPLLADDSLILETIAKTHPITYGSTIKGILEVGNGDKVVYIEDEKGKETQYALIGNGFIKGEYLPLGLAIATNQHPEEVKKYFLSNVAFAEAKGDTKGKVLIITDVYWNNSEMRKRLDSLWNESKIKPTIFLLLRDDLVLDKESSEKKEWRKKTSKFLEAGKENYWSVAPYEFFPN